MLFLFLLLPLIVHCSELTEGDPIPIFHPPSGWECALPDNLSPCVQIGFLGKGSGPFRPSINLATEEVDVNLTQYLKAVKEIHLSEKGTVWRDLGKFKTHSGEGRLTEIDKKSAAGLVKMLQMIFISGKTAYILTGAAIKEDFLAFQEDFLKTFQSLRIEKDLFSRLPLEKKMKFEIFFSEIAKSLRDESEKEARWADLQTLVVQEEAQMGSYWQFLVLKNGREKIYR